MKMPSKAPAWASIYTYTVSGTSRSGTNWSHSGEIITQKGSFVLMPEKVMTLAFDMFTRNDLGPITITYLLIEEKKEV